MKRLPNIKNVKGFTLIELLVVIGILAILLSIVLIAINPARQFGQANNTRRRSDVTQILNAIGAYAADNKGVLPIGIPVGTASAVFISGSTATPPTGFASAPVAGYADLCSELVPNYIPALPQDPQAYAGTSVTNCSDTTYFTGYTVSQDANHRVTVSAPNAENNEIISNTR